MPYTPLHQTRPRTQRSMYQRLFLLAIVAGAATFIFFSSSSSSSSSLKLDVVAMPSMPPAGPHLLASGRPDYCSATATGDEGYSSQGRRGARQLRAVAIVIRHGDRSAINGVPNSTGLPARWRCQPRAHEAARREWPALGANFVVRRLKDGAALPRTLRSALLEGSDAASTSACAPGQLTPRGFEQHVRLGSHLSTSYAPLLDALSANASSRLGAGQRSIPPAIFVRSTDYSRTLLSAAGLLTGLLRQHPALRPSLAHPQTLFTEDVEEEDYMHGVGLASSSKAQNRPRLEAAVAAPAASSSTASVEQPQQQQHALQPPQGAAAAEVERQGKCSTAARLAKQAIRTWQPQHPEAWHRLEGLFGKPALATMKTTGTADALFARACHGLPPPCSTAGCVDQATQHGVWSDAHSFYCERFGGSQGGERASRLAMLPLLRDIVQRLLAAAHGKGSERLILFSGHDTVVAPLLAALGGMRSPELCRWPPYASHITFEVWSSSLAERGPADALEVRVLFNGEAVTQYLYGCEVGKAGAEGGFCPLSALAETVRKLGVEFDSTCGEYPYASAQSGRGG